MGDQRNQIRDKDHDQIRDEDHDQIRHDQAALEHLLADLVSEGVCLAFSGGTDSSILLYLACKVRRSTDPPVHAVYFSTELHPQGERELAEKLAPEWGAELTILELNEFDDPAILSNPPDRCYHCKHELFTTLDHFRKEKGCRWIIDGSHADDRPEKRPGMRALAEIGVRSPLRELGIGKKRVRELAARCGLSISDKPSMPCLATRLPYYTPLDPDVLARIDQAEHWLRDRGLYNVRVRLHGDIARIEVDAEALGQVVAMKKELVQEMKRLGFHYISLDLEGFRSGSMDE